MFEFRVERVGTSHPALKRLGVIGRIVLVFYFSAFRFYYFLFYLLVCSRWFRRRASRPQLGPNGISECFDLPLRFEAWRKS